MAYGGHLLQTLYLGIPANATVPASMAGTASGITLSSSLSITHASKIQIFNLTLRNLELQFGGAAGGTADFTPGTPTVVNGKILFCPGTASVAALGMNVVHEMPVSQGMSLYVRTTENTPVTCSSVAPLIISFWS